MVCIDVGVRLAPSLLYGIWVLIFIILGIMAAVQDWTVSNHCVLHTHIMKYTVLNTTFAMVGVLSYFLFPGGGEAARARALMMLFFHFGLAAWGYLLWSDLGRACADILRSHYEASVQFHHISVAHNFVMMMLFAAHELWLGHLLRLDFTLSPNINKVIVDSRMSGPAEVIDQDMHSMKPAAQHDHFHPKDLHAGTSMSQGIFSGTLSTSDQP